MAAETAPAPGPLQRRARPRTGVGFGRARSPDRVLTRSSGARRNRRRVVAPRRATPTVDVVDGM